VSVIGVHYWKEIATDTTKYPGIHRELWINGTVYQLFKKGMLVDLPVHCYVSHGRSLAQTVFQFGAASVVCAIDDAEHQRAANTKEADKHLADSGVSRDVLMQAGFPRETDLALQDAAYRRIRRFLDIYFRS